LDGRRLNGAKNWTVVRRAVGYQRYETDAQLQRNISSLQSAIGGLATPTKHTTNKPKKEVIVPSHFEHISI